MSLTFYWIWSVLGVLIILFVVVMTLLMLMLAKRAYDLVGLIYKEQQEIIGRVMRKTRPRRTQVESQGVEGQPEDKEETPVESENAE